MSLELSGCWSGYRDRVWLGAGRDDPSAHLLGAAACDCRQVTFLLPPGTFLVCKMRIIVQAQRIR